jgi:hypothetical protein
VLSQGNKEEIDMLNLKIVPKVEISFTADQWELFASDLVAKGQGIGTRNGAASKLNRALEKAINTKGATESSIWQAMIPVMRAQAHWGANDSEANRLIDNVLDKVLPK